MKASLVAALSIVAVASHGAASPAEKHWEMAGRAPSARVEDALSGDASGRASLLLRAMDYDRDHHLSAEDARALPEVLAEHLPGVDEEQFAAFVETADTDGDRRLSRDELADGLAGGALAGDHTEMLEVDAMRRRKGIWKSIKKFGRDVLGNVKTKVKTGIRRATGRVDQANDACVMCQYIVERLETNVRQSGVIPSMPTGDIPNYVANSADNPFAPYVPMTPGPAPGAGTAPSSESSAPRETNPAPEAEKTGEQETAEKVEFVETEARVSDPYDAAASGIIAASRESTRAQRQMERQKYNEIYRVVDITLDDVCEQSCPSAFYGFCKQIYATQSDVVEGLRYQYRPADICFRVGMCGKGSYITKGIHSRYN